MVEELGEVREEEADEDSMAGAEEEMESQKDENKGSEDEGSRSKSVLYNYTLQ